jgi:hypothetical protein
MLSNMDRKWLEDFTKDWSPDQFRSAFFEVLHFMSVPHWQQFAWISSFQNRAFKGFPLPQPDPCISPSTQD